MPINATVRNITCDIINVLFFPEKKNNKSIIKKRKYREHRIIVLIPIRYGNIILKLVFKNIYELILQKISSSLVF